MYANTTAGQGRGFAEPAGITATEVSMPEVLREIRDLGHAVESLHKHLDGLSERLSLALHPAQASEGRGEEPKCGTQLGKRLQSIRGAVADATRRIAALQSSLAI